MDSLLTACQDVSGKQSTMQTTITHKISALKSILQEAKSAMENDPSKAHEALVSLQEKTKKLQFQKAQKEFQSALSKFGKEVDRKFKEDVSQIYHPEAFANKGNLICRALAFHFIRKGQFELCDEFLDEAGIALDDELRVTIEKLKNEFEQMYKVLCQIEKEQDLTSAIEWAKDHRDELKNIASTLEFNLHRMRFIQILLSVNAIEAINYGRQNFGAFGEKHYNEIKKVMTAPLYVDDLSSSRYADLCSPHNWVDIKQQFQRDFCSLLKMSAESPLYTSVFVGTTALPVIVKLYKIMLLKKAEWSAQDELPVEIAVDEELRYHSVFVCPVSKEQATDDNPPMMMTCGHVICKESLLRLSRNNSRTSGARFKCPYCPSESSIDQALQVYF